jgi:hypothetical protein
MPHRGLTFLVPLAAGMLALPPPASAAASPKTVFQCEKRYKEASARERCFKQLPGASCAHPLEVQKTFPNYRGDTKDFTVSLKNEPNHGNTFEVIYNYKPNKGVAICPHGAVFKVSLQYRRLPNGTEEQAPAGYEEQDIPEPTTRNGGEFSYQLTVYPVKSWYLAVRGYYIHPPGERAR